MLMPRTKTALVPLFSKDRKLNQEASLRSSLGVASRIATGRVCPALPVWLRTSGLLPLLVLVLCLDAVCVRADDQMYGEPVPEGESENVEVTLGPTTGLVVDAGPSRLELHAYTWLRAETDTRVGDETDLQASVPVGRVILQGSFFDSQLHFFAQPEFGGGSTRLLDLFAEWHVSDALQFRVGQFRTPYSRAFITPLTNLELPTRGLLVDAFGLGRDTGAMASGTLADGGFHYDLAIVNGATINDRDGNRDVPAIVGRTEFRFGEPVPYNQAPSLALEDPRGLTLGLGGAFSRRAVQGAPGTSTEQLWNAAADLAWMHGPLSVLVEGFWRGAHGSPRPANAFGVYVQSGVFVVPRRLEVGGRAGWLSDGPDVQSYEAFLASYWKVGATLLGHHLKTIFGYRFDSGDTRGGGDLRDRHVVLIQTQLFF